MAFFVRPAVLAMLLAALAGCAAAGPRAPDFTLRDDGGRPWSLSAQRGKAVLLTFGFTHCADTCPATLAKLGHLARALGPRGADLALVFVTVDPQRDTPPELHAFVGRFDGPIVGLTGTSEQIDAVENAYHVWAQRIPCKHPSGGYDVAHSTAIYFIDRSGRIRDLREDDDPQAVLDRAAREVLG